MKLFYSYGTALCLLGVLTAPVLAMEGFEKIGESPKHNIQIMRSAHMSDEQKKSYEAIAQKCKNRGEMLTDIEYIVGKKTGKVLYHYTYLFDNERQQKYYLTPAGQYFEKISEANDYIRSLKATTASLEANAKEKLEKDLKFLNIKPLNITTKMKSDNFCVLSFDFLDKQGKSVYEFYVGEGVDKSGAYFTDLNALKAYITQKYPTELEGFSQHFYQTELALSSKTQSRTSSITSILSALSSENLEGSTRDLSSAKNQSQSLPNGLDDLSSDGEEIQPANGVHMVVGGVAEASLISCTPHDPEDFNKNDTQNGWRMAQSIVDQRARGKKSLSTSLTSLTINRVRHEGIPKEKSPLGFFRNLLKSGQK